MSDDCKIQIKYFNDYPDCENETIDEYGTVMKLINTEILVCGAATSGPKITLRVKTFIDSNNEFHVRTFLI